MGYYRENSAGTACDAPGAMPPCSTHPFSLTMSQLIKMRQSNTTAASRSWHIPSDLVVDHWTSDGESSSHRDVLLLHDVWTTSNRLSGHKITSTISMG